LAAISEEWVLGGFRYEFLEMILCSRKKRRNAVRAGRKPVRGCPTSENPSRTMSGIRTLVTRVTGFIRGVVGSL